MLDEKFQRNTSKFAIFYIYENLKWLFRFSFLTTLYFSIMNALVYVDIDHGMAFIREKNKVAQNEKRKKQLWVFAYIKYGKF